ncbi:MAG: hypothetical protein A2X48_21435 [Lentisphaerae bacterium GWF2_49_21]|nr:MAG: hypothetical protein A2X48_21435 [Lentisphaerae bacterium GWF2_49_21]
MKYLKLLSLVCLMAGISSFSTSRACAQEINNSTEIADAGKELQFAMVSCRSLARLTEFAKEYGITLPPLIQTAALEKIFPFLGAGNIDGSRPYGAVYLAGDNISQKNACVFCIPLRDPGKSMNVFSNPNGVKVEGVKNMMTINGMPFRLIGSYFVFGGTPEYVAFLQTIPFSAHYASSDDVLVEISLDFKSLRAHAPSSIDKFVDMVDKQNKVQNVARGAVNNAREAGQKAAYDWMKSFGNTVDTMKMRISSNDQGVRAEILSQPVKAKVKDMKFNGILPPVSSPVALHMSGCSEITGGLLDWIFKQISESKEPASNPDPESVKSMMKAFAAIVAGGDAASMGISGDEDAMRIFIVNQYQDKPDLAAMIRDFMAKAEKAAPAMNETSIATHKTIDGKNGTMHHVSLISSNEAGASIYAIQTGNRIFVVVSEVPDDSLLPWISNVKEGAPLKPGLSLSMNVGSLLEMMQNSPSSKLSMLSKEEMDSFKSDFADESRMECVIKDGQSHIGIEVPRKSLKALQKLFVVLGTLPVPRKNSEAALDKIERRIKAYPDLARNYVMRAVLMREKEEYGKAIDSYNMALKLNDKNFQIFFSRAETYYFFGETEKAKEDLRKAIELAFDKNKIYPLIRLWHISGMAENKKEHEDLSRRIAEWKFSPEAPWPEPCFKFISGVISEDELMEKAKKAPKTRGSLCEAYCLIGVKSLLDGKRDAASDAFQDCVNLNYEEQREHKISKFELKKLEKTQPNQ